MATRVTQLAYNSGELGELMAGRVDDTKYASGLAICQNAYPTPQGPVKNRAGFMYVNEVKDSSKAVRLIPFVYSADQQLIVELGDHYARFHLKGQTLMKMDGSAPYEIATPWRAEDLFQIHYTQNADIMTLVHPAYPPQELRRYSMNDWRMAAVTLLATLRAPANVVAVRVSSAYDDKNAERYTQYYCVTALNGDRTEESESSAAASCVANLYATGTTVRVSWDAVSGARFYRVYKLQGGVYGYIGETTTNSIVDDNIAPETGTTPPYVDDVLRLAKGIVSAQVVNGGSGYYQNAVAPLGSDFLEKFPSRMVADWYWRPGDPTNNGQLGGELYASYSNGALVLSCRQEGYRWLEAAEIAVIPGLGSDEKGSGSGAVVEWDTSYSYSALGGSEGGESGITYRETLTIRSIRLASGGSDYAEPYLRILLHGPYAYQRLRVPLSVAPAPTCAVVDDTGWGAKVTLGAVDGRIASASVVSGGRNYTNPRAVIKSTTGSGAEIKLSLGEAGDYPAAVGYFEQRRIFAGSQLRPQTIWMTVTGTENNMTYHLPLQDTDRIAFSVAARDLNQIQHIVALQQLIALTSAAEWRVSPLNSDAITPSSISVRPQSYIGASTVQPQIINTNLLYAAARGGHIRELAYDYTAGGYITGDISIRAPHLFTEDNVTVDMALTKSPDPVLWCVRQDGALLGLSYVPEQKIAAWFQYKTDGAFESAAVVQEGLADYLYVVVRRTVNGRTVRFVERQMTRADDYRDSCPYLDCSGRYQGVDRTDAISGLTWLEGRTVTAVGDGIVFPNLAVTGGKVKLPQACLNVWVGLPYVSEVKTLPVALPSQDGTYARGRVKNIGKVILRLMNTSGVEVGPDVEHMRPLKARTLEEYGEPPKLRSGEFEVLPTGTWTNDGSFMIRQAEPLPFTLICHSAEVTIGDDK